MPEPTSFRLPGKTLKQLKDLADHYGMTKAGVLVFIIQRAWKNIQRQEKAEKGGKTE